VSRRPKYAQAVDRNQREIVKALEDHFCDVRFINCPADLLVGFRGKNFLLEVKVPKSKGEKGGELTDEQKKFIAAWRGHYAVVQTVDEALQAVGLKS